MKPLPGRQGGRRGGRQLLGATDILDGTFEWFEDLTLGVSALGFGCFRFRVNGVTGFKVLGLELGV